MKLRYDSRLRVREIRITIKAMAIVNGSCNAEPVTAYLAANFVDWGNAVRSEDDDDADDGLRPMRGDVLDDDMWMISHVNRRLDSVVLVRPDLELGEIMNVSMQVTLDGIIPGG